ncbi:hypothetical protein PRIPAC_87072 [Pristionchus pacificus]|nr:hypothetical protein PRIPAC_87072 [Pristionchus pacificus]
MSDEASKHSAAAKQYWSRFEDRVKEEVDSFLNSGSFCEKNFNRYMLKLSKRLGIDLSESEIETTRGVLTENVKKDVLTRLDDIKNDMDFIPKFEELFALDETSPDDVTEAIRNTQNANMDMEFFKVEPTENYAQMIEDIAVMYEEVNEEKEKELVEMVDEMTEMRNWINKEIERKRCEKRNAHSEGNVRRLAPNRRSSLGVLNASRRSIDSNQ